MCKHILETSLVTALHDIFFKSPKKFSLYFYPVMLSDPMGHTQSTNDKQSSMKPSQGDIGYLTCFMC